MKDVIQLIRKDFLLEIRQKYALNAILLYVVSTVFVVQLSFGRIIDESAWIALFWIILLFAAFNAVSKSFIQEHTARRLYYFVLASPISIILSKIIYNSFLMVFLGFLSLALYVLFLGMPQFNPLLLYPSFILGCIGLASALTMVSAIASSAGNNAALMAVLGFPIVIPLLLLVINAFKLSLQEVIAPMQIVKSITSLLLIDAVVVILAVILFPYLWRK
ncbi:MAG: heme exporter protein CcmB [Omnitrophica WOR_2 bacterium]